MFKPEMKIMNGIVMKIIWYYSPMRKFDFNREFKNNRTRMTGLCLIEGTKSIAHSQNNESRTRRGPGAENNN